jgi:hypothetical protein
MFRPELVVDILLIDSFGGTASLMRLILAKAFQGLPSNQFELCSYSGIESHCAIVAEFKFIAPYVPFGGQTEYL